MRSEKVVRFVESYLYGACGHRALEQSVFAEGERRGFSEAKLRRAALALGVRVTAGCWELPAAIVQALDAASIRTLDERSSRRPLVVSGGGVPSLRRHAA